MDLPHSPPTRPAANPPVETPVLLTPAPAANGHPAANGSPRPAPPPRAGSPRRRRRWLWAAVPALLLGLAAGAVAFVPGARPAVNQALAEWFPAKRPDLILHKVKPEFLQVSVVERGTLESADNKDVTCKVKAGSRGSFASTIKWVIDDGSIVAKGQLLMELDDSALQDQYRTQSIAVEKAKAEWEKADNDLVITVKGNESDVASAVAALRMAELDLEKYLGLRADPALNPAGALAGGPASLAERGEYRQRLDEISGKLKLAEGDLEAYRDRAAWADRSTKFGYLTPSQAKVEQSKLAGGMDNVANLSKQKFIMEAFQRQKELTDLASKLKVADLGLDRAQRQAAAKQNQAESTRRTAYSVFQQELEKLREIEDQIRECKVLAPQDGMAVYYKEGGNRWGNSTEGLIQQGAQVKEGQKLLRIPNLQHMQVNTKVHEAMVSRIRGDDRQSTGFFDSVRAGLLAGPSPWARLAANSEQALAVLREEHRDKEYVLASRGQKAAVRVDAFPDRVLPGHVRTVAAVASQQDWMSSDVKVYQTLVTIDDEVPGLKPDMSAEVTIQVDPARDPVLCVPLQAVVGGAEAGPKRKVYVMGPAGPEPRDVTLGLFNDKMVEIKDGLADGDAVVLNPKAVLGNTAKTREESAEPAGRRGGPGGAGKDKGAKAGGGKGGPAGGKAGGPPAGAGGGAKQ